MYAKLTPINDARRWKALGSEGGDEESVQLQADSGQGRVVRRLPVDAFLATDWAVDGLGPAGLLLELGLYGTYHASGNEYDDGVIEVGEIGLQASGIRYAMITDESGPVHCTRDLDLEVEVADDGYPEKMHWTIDGEQWLWQRQHGAECSDPVRSTVPVRPGFNALARSVN